MTTLLKIYERYHNEEHWGILKKPMDKEFHNESILPCYIAYVYRKIKNFHEQSLYGKLLYSWLKKSSNILKFQKKMFLYWALR